MNNTKQIMNRTKALAALTLTVMSTTAISTAAYAGDSKIYSGSVCQPYLGSNEPKVIRFNSISSFTNEPFHIVCPIIRDNTQTVSTNRVVATVQRFAGAQTNGDGLKCELYVYNKGTFVSRDTKFAPNGIGQHTLDMTTNHVSGASYELFCFLPKGTSMIQYTTVEP